MIRLSLSSSVSLSLLYTIAFPPISFSPVDCGRAGQGSSVRTITTTDGERESSGFSARGRDGFCGVLPTLFRPAEPSRASDNAGAVHTPAWI